jgi:hypothetical protein
VREVARRELPKQPVLATACASNSQKSKPQTTTKSGSEKEQFMRRHTKGLFGLSIALLVVCLFGSNAAVAQTGTTSLRGTILDKSGAAIVGAKVTLSNSQQGFERTVLSGETGRTNSLDWLLARTR